MHASQVSDHECPGCLEENVCHHKHESATNTAIDRFLKGQVKKLQVWEDDRVFLAESDFEKRKFHSAYEHYFHASECPEELFDPISVERLDQVFYQNRMFLSKLADNAGAEELFFSICDDEGADHQIAYESMALASFNSRKFMDCVLTSVIGLKKYGESNLLRDVIKECFRLEPSLLSSLDQIQQLPQSANLSWQRPKIRPEMELGPHCTDKDVNLHRLVHCIKNKKLKLGLSLLRRLDTIEMNTQSRCQFACLEAQLLVECEDLTTIRSRIEKGFLKEFLFESPTPFLDAALKLSELQVKLNRIEEAESIISKALELYNSGQMTKVSWPKEVEDCCFPKSSGESVEQRLRNMLNQMIAERCNKSTCRAPECLQDRREVFSFDTCGLYRVNCSEKCSIDVHQQCWKKFKTSRCFTPDCQGEVVEVFFKREPTENFAKVKDAVLAPKPVLPKNNESNPSKEEVAADKSAHDTKARSKRRDKSTDQHALKTKEQTKKSEARPETPKKTQEVAPDANGAKPKRQADLSEAKRSTNKLKNHKQQYRQNIERYDEIRQQFRQSIDANSLLSHLISTSSSEPRYSDAIVNVDGCSMSVNQLREESKRMTDQIRESMSAQKLEESKKKKKEKEVVAKPEQDLNHYLSRLELEQELSFFLYSSLVSALKDKIKLQEKVANQEREIRDVMVRFEQMQLEILTNDPRAISPLPRIPDGHLIGETAPQVSGSQDVQAQLRLLAGEAEKQGLDVVTIESEDEELDEAATMSPAAPATSQPSCPDDTLTYLRMAYPDLSDEELKSKVSLIADNKNEEQIPTKVQEPSALMSSNDVEEVDECVICRDPLSFKMETVLGCGHKYHKECIDTWFQKDHSCPICRNHEIRVDEYPFLSTRKARRNH